MLSKRFDIDTAKGVRWVIKCKGMTGYGAQYFSTETKKNPKIILAIRSPKIIGFDHFISSVDFKLNPKRRQPTAPTRVKEPRKSMRRNFSDKLWFWISSGSWILTFVATTTQLKISTGAYGSSEHFVISEKRTIIINLHIERGAPARHRKLSKPESRSTNTPSKLIIHPASQWTAQTWPKTKQSKGSWFSWGKENIKIALLTC